MQTQLKEMVAKYMQQVWNEKNLDAVNVCVTEDVIIHSPLGDFHSSETMKDVIRAWLKGFPDLSIHHEVIMAENDLVSIQWKAEGTHTGEFKGKAPTGKLVKYSGITVYRIKDFKIIEYWAYLDMQHLFSQLG